MLLVRHSSFVPLFSTTSSSSRPPPPLNTRSACRQPQAPHGPACTRYFFVSGQTILLSRSSSCMPRKCLRARLCRGIAGEGTETHHGPGAVALFGAGAWQYLVSPAALSALPARDTACLWPFPSSSVASPPARDACLTLRVVDAQECEHDGGARTRERSTPPPRGPSRGPHSCAISRGRSAVHLAVLVASGCACDPRARGRCQSARSGQTRRGLRRNPQRACANFAWARQRAH